MIYQADWLLTLDGNPLPDGWLEIEADCILAVGSGGDLPKGREIRKMENCVLLPGLINAHCHLEFTALENQLAPGQPFPAWVDALRGVTGKFSPADFLASSIQGVAALLKGGTTTVVDVGNTGEALTALAQSPLRSYAFIETLGLDPELAETRFAFARQMAEKFVATSLFHPGVAPHSAYSCSIPLLSKTVGYQTGRHLPWTIHLSESREEEELFASASGPLFQYGRRFYPDAPKHLHSTPVQWLESQGLLPERALCVHGNHLNEKDIAILSRFKAAIVHCPSSHAFFGHKAFPYSELREAGIPICLGTDSAASGNSLSMLDQMRLFAGNFPKVPPEEILRMATVIASEAVGMENKLGKLKAGYKADFIAITTPSRKNPLGSILNPETSVTLSVINGKEAA